jgi:predicted pyridoxine 5'-phosphate oxidase superfamily flavin-nucleotide-binding protein
VGKGVGTVPRQSWPKLCAETNAGQAKTDIANNPKRRRNVNPNEFLLIKFTVQKYFKIELEKTNMVAKTMQIKFSIKISEIALTKHQAERKSI